MTNLTQKTISGASLTFLAAIATAVTQAVILIILARLLTPIDYGRFAIATIAARFSVGICGGVIERALLTRQTDEHGISSPLIPLILVLLISSIAIICGYFIIDHRDTQMFVGLAIVQLAAVPPSIMLSTRVSLRKDIRIKPIVLADFLAQFIGLGVVTAALAYCGFGVLALAIGSLAQGIVQALLLFIARRPDFSVPVTKISLLLIARSSLRVLPTALLELSFVQLPSMLIGWQLGIHYLGLFNRIYSLVQLPIEMLATSMTRVLVAGLIQARNDEARTKRALSRLITVGAAIMTPVVGGIIGSHTQFVNVVLSPRWQEGTSFVQIVVLSTWFGVLAHLFAVFSEAKALYSPKAIIQAQAIVVQLFAMVVCGYFGGLVGATVGLAVSNFFFLVVNIRLTSENLHISPAELLRWLRSGLAAGIVSGACGYTIAYLMDGMNLYFIFMTQILSCGIGSSIVFCVEKSMMAEFTQMFPVKKIFGKT